MLATRGIPFGYGEVGHQWPTSLLLGRIWPRQTVDGGPQTVCKGSDR